jgi:hypothetical protein
MIIADGVVPSNEGRGYVLRRLLRRAARHARLFGAGNGFLSGLTQVVVDLSRAAYPELTDKSEYVKKMISVEEERFAETIEQGLVIYRDSAAKLESEGGRTIGGDVAFKLHDTYGFPIDLTRELAAEDGFVVDDVGFSQLMEAQRTRARAALGAKGAAAWAASDVESTITSSTGLPPREGKPPKTSLIYHCAVCAAILTWRPDSAFGPDIIALIKKRTGWSAVGAPCLPPPAHNTVEINRMPTTAKNNLFFIFFLQKSNFSSIMILPVV